MHEIRLPHNKLIAIAIFILHSSVCVGVSVCVGIEQAASYMSAQLLCINYAVHMHQLVGAAAIVDIAYKHIDTSLLMLPEMPAACRSKKFLLFFFLV